MISSYRTYYVNCKTGSDTNDGMSMDSPFASLFPINTLTLNPGDRVLLAKDSILQGSFCRLKTVGRKSIPLRLVLIPQQERRGKTLL